MNERVRAGLLVAAITGMAMSSCAPSDGLRTAPPVASAGGAIERALGLPAVWSPLPVDLNLTAGARRLCLPSLFARPTLPSVLQDRREPDTALVVFADANKVAWCMVRRTADGTIEAGEAAVGPPWRLGSGQVVGHGGLTINEGNTAPAGQWSYLIGLAPAGTASIRMVAGGRRVDGVVAGQMYSVSWPGGQRIVLVAAFDEQGNEIDRLDERSLAVLFDCRERRGCSFPS